MSNAPVCHVSPDEVITQPTAKAAALPALPTSLASALSAIAMLTAAVRELQQQLLTPTSGTILTTKTPPPPKQPSWIQLSRVTENVKVTNPNDPTQYVIIERINKLVMQDRVTGQTWIWTR